MTKLSRAFLFALAVTATVPAYAGTNAYPVESSIVAHDDVRIEVLAQGAGPVIVILPSLGRSGADYDVVSANLASDGFQGIATAAAWHRAEQGADGRSVDARFGG